MTQIANVFLNNAVHWHVKRHWYSRI